MVLWRARQKVNDRLSLQVQRTWHNIQMGCRETGLSCSFCIRSGVSGYGSSCSRRIVSETKSGRVRHPIEPFNSNWSCIKLCKNPIMHKKSKHIEAKLNFVRHKIEDGIISIHYVPTDKMAVDIFTNPLSVSKVETFGTTLIGTDSTHSTQLWVGLQDVRISIKL